VTRQWRGATFKIQVVNPKGVERGVVVDDAQRSGAARADQAAASRVGE